MIRVFRLGLASLITTSLFSSQVLPVTAQELRIIADAVSIEAAHPQGDQLDSFFAGIGTGLYPQMNARGEVVLGARTWDGNPAGSAAISLYTYRPNQGLVHLIGDDAVVTGTMGELATVDIGSAINLGYKPTITHDGGVLLACPVEGIGISEPNNLGIIRTSSGNSGALVVRQGGSIASRVVASIQAAVEPAEQISERFLAVTLDSGGGPSALLHDSALGLTTLTGVGMNAPGIPGATVVEMPHLLRSTRAVGVQRDLVFTGVLTGADISPENNDAVWHYRSGELRVVARDGEPAANDPIECRTYGAAYGRPMVNRSGQVAFHASDSCGRGISILSDRSGELRREVVSGINYDGPTGRVRLGLLSEIATAFASLGDATSYHRMYLSDQGDLFVLSSLFHEDGSLRSS